MVLPALASWTSSSYQCGAHGADAVCDRRNPLIHVDGQRVVIPLFAVPITVLPTPILNVDYFLQHDVLQQDR